MILYSPAKINIGLRIIERRKDGFHNLQSIMCPVGLCDIIEINSLSPGEKKIRFHQSGLKIDSLEENNLCMKAWEIFSSEAPLPPVEIHLHKQIPVGAGLGGGSSNASAILKGLNFLTGNLLSEQVLHEMAASLGSDCPFFLYEKPMLMEGRGEILNPLSIHLDKLHLVLLFPEIHISTAEAYGGINPVDSGSDLKEKVKEPMRHWKDLIINDFEASVFNQYPELKELKDVLYEEGAVYASLSGSGSSLYGFFPNPPILSGKLKKYKIWNGELTTIT